MPTPVNNAGRTKNVVNLRGPVLHLSAELKNICQRGLLANIVYRVAFEQVRSGLDVRVVLPGSPRIDTSQIENLKEEGLYLHGTLDSIPVYILKRSETEPHFSALYPSEAEHPGDAEILENYRDFGSVFWGMVDNKIWGEEVALVHLWDHTMGWVSPQRPLELGRIRKVFTPIEPETHFKAYSTEEIQSLNWTTIPGYGRVSGFMQGIQHADLITEWYWGFFGELKEKVPALNPFLSSQLKAKIRFFSLEGQGWRPSMETDIPQRSIDALEEAYLQVLYGKDHEFALRLMKLYRKGAWNPNGVFVNVVHRAHEERGAVLAEEMGEMGIPVQEAIERYKHGMKFKNNVGGLLEMAEKLPSSSKGTYFFLLAAGPGTRAGIVSLTCGAMKNRMRIVNEPMTKLVIDQAPQIALQLPDKGEGWVVYFGNDNILVADGPLHVGKKLARHAKQKILLVAQPINIRYAELNDINILKERGIMIPDPETGEALHFLEKVKKEDDDNEGKKDDFDRAKIVRDYLNKLDMDHVFQNTFYMALTQDMVKIFLDSDHYSQPTVKSDGKKVFHEDYSLDWSKHFVEPATIERLDDWIRSYEEDEKKTQEERAKTKISLEFARKDWETLWHIAQDLKKKANGIGVIDIGEKAIWNDLGVNEDFKEMNFEIFSEDKEIFRELLEVPLDLYVRDSFIQGVEFPEDHSNVFVDHSVFRKGGKVGKRCIIVDTIFHEKVEIPDNTLVQSGRFYKIKIDENDIRTTGTILYNVRLEAYEDFEIQDDRVHGTAIFSDGSAKRGTHSITSYDKNNPIEGVDQTVEQAKTEVSISRSRNTDKDHLDKLERLLTSLGREDKTL